MKLRYRVAALLLAAVAVSCREPVQAAKPAPTAAAPTAAPVMCVEHGVPEAVCTICNPALAAVFQSKGDWCGAHGLPESFCPICNPDAPMPDVGAAPVVPADWCAGHGLPESSCTKCNPELIPRFQAAGDWCAAHGFPESACPICSPQQPPSGAPVADWCLEHALPESMCTKCNRELADGFRAAGDWCAEHGFPESACPICNPQAPPSGAEQGAIEARVVRFRTPAVEADAGLVTVAARRAATVASVDCTARIAFDSDRTADVRALLPGIVRRVQVELGERVGRGDPLFQLESTQVGEIQGRLHTARERVRTARANLDREGELRERGIATDRAVELAEQELAAAEAQAQAAEVALRMAGAERTAPSGGYTLAAPIAGTIIRRPAIVGLFATEGTSLALIADTSVMWGLLDVREADAARVAVGQPVSIHVDGGDQTRWSGAITWIAAEVDPRTRTVLARAEIPNPDGRLRANQFARARIETSAARTAVSVPRAAVQRVGDHEVVFVRSSPGVYQPRVVKRHGEGELVQIEGGVREGDEIVTTGAVLLRTEIMPGSIGAGCCEIVPREGS